MIGRATLLALLVAALWPAAAAAQHTGHTVHDEAINTFVLFDQLEWQTGASDGAHWDGRAWIGTDRDRLWLRTEGASDRGRLHSGDAHVLFGRAISPWWEVVAGVRQDVRPGPAQTWVAFGVQGLAPQWIAIEATGYLGAGGRTQLRLKAEHDLLLTNRLVLQPKVEAQLAGKADRRRDVGAGLSTVEAGIRLRYEIRRELAPYVGVNWHRGAGRSAGHVQAASGSTSGVSVVAGLRFWM
jgi:copper resistance protein B